tara:strand:+ start:53 stop:373 length:321 start_codon:yes stop_codon:yes gene_type:complete
MNYNKDEEYIDISITIGNSRNWNVILTGKTYYFNIKRNTKIELLLNEFYNNFEGEGLDEIKRYSIFTHKMIKLNKDDALDISFSDINASYLELVDGEEFIFYVLLV